MSASAGFEIVVDTGGLNPPQSGVGYYALELLKAYAALPGRFPLTLFTYRFFLKSRPGLDEAFFNGLARGLGGRLEVHRRLLPGPVHARLRSLGLRSPVPADGFAPQGRRIYFFPNTVGEPLGWGSCVPIVYDFSFLRFPRGLPGRDDLFLKRYLPRTLRRALQVVVISDCVSRELQQAYDFPAERITIVRPAVDHSRFRPDIPAAVRRAVRKKYGLPAGFIFSLGTIEPRKNYARLIEAYARLLDGPKRRAPLVIAGGAGWKNRDVGETIRRLGMETAVRLLGYVADEDRAPLIRDAALLALPSLYEGFGMPVLEAMACGTPVVISARGALPEVAGDSAMYVDPLRPDDIARGLGSVLDDERLRARLSAGGLRRAAGFQWEASARILAGVFDKAAEAVVSPRPD